MSDILEQIRTNVIAGRLDSEDEGVDGDMAGQPGVIELVRQAIDEGVSAKEILTKAINPGMEKVGALFESGEYLTPDMLASAECVSEAMDILEPLLLSGERQDKGTFIIATVEGDLHDIGKNIVATMLKGSGFDVQDLGTAVKADRIVQAVKEVRPKYLGLSALLTSTMAHMEEVIEMLKKEGLRDQVKVLIGGAPVSQEYADKIGADFYCQDAFDAVNKLS